MTTSRLRLTGSSRLADGQARIENGFNFSAFYEVLADVVGARNMTWRLVALETEVTTETLKRISHGTCPDASTLAVLAAWAELDLADFVAVPPDWTRSDTVALISTILRTDPELDASSVGDLEVIIRLAYDRFKQPHVDRDAIADAA